MKSSSVKILVATLFFTAIAAFVAYKAGMFTKDTASPEVMDSVKTETPDTNIHEEELDEEIMESTKSGKIIELEDVSPEKEKEKEKEKVNETKTNNNTHIELDPVIMGSSKSMPVFLPEKTDSNKKSNRK